MNEAIIADAVSSGREGKLRAFLRAACRRSLYYHIKVAVCYNEPINLMSKHTFKESCDWLAWVVTTKKRGLFEDPRATIKSTRVARGIPSWYAIQRPDERYDAPEEFDRAARFVADHPHLKGPDGRIVLGSDSKERASKFVGSSKTDWETNPILRFAFPELLWTNYNRLPYGSWKETAYTLNGRVHKSLPDPYLSAVGLDSKIQGGRAEVLIIDDLVGETSYNSPAELERRKSWVKTAGFLLENRDYENPRGGAIIVDGNRWSLDDVNSMIHNEFKDWAIWHRSSFKCIVHGFGNCGRWDDETERPCADSDEPIWPEAYADAAALERVERDVGPVLFAAQFRNDPTREAELDASKLRTFNLLPQTYTPLGHDKPRRDWCVVVPKYNNDGVEVGTDELIPITALSKHLISIDPASSKDERNARTCVSWFALDKPTSRVFNLGVNAGHWEAERAVEEAYKLIMYAHDRIGDSFRPEILIEKVAMQTYFKPALSNYAERKGMRLGTITDIPPAVGVAKDDRIRRRVGNRLNQGLLYLVAGAQLPKFELRHFPTGTKDWLDTVAQAEEIYLEEFGSVRSDRLARKRIRERQRRLASATRAGVPL